MSNFTPFFYRLISRVTGQSYTSAWDEKLPHILLGMVGFLLFCIIFSAVYWNYLAKIDQRIKQLFVATATLLGGELVLKYGVSLRIRGYWSDRWFFYAVPSPRLESFMWLGLASAIAFLFIYFRSYFERLKRWQFLIVTMTVFIGFALAVAGIRGGVSSIIDPLTRTYWEYTGALPFIKDAPDFLRNFISLIPRLPVHVQLHPPGYPLVLYGWQQFFSVGLLGMAVLLIMTASLSFIPIFYVAERWRGGKEARSIISMMVFSPALVLFSATSVEAIFVAVVSYALVAAFFGWKEKMSWSVAAGVFMALGVLGNFLFLLLGPCFLAFIVYLIRTAPADKWKIILRVILSGASFLTVFVILWLLTGYSPVTNFFIARSYNSALVESNFSSLLVYFGYMFMNVLEFGFYFGIPLLVVFIRQWPESFQKSALWFKFGLFNLTFFLIVGIFQGEVGRIWLFIVPFFLFFYSPFFVLEDKKFFSAFLALLAAQSIIVQLLFYTFW
ncbi:MAG: hypothetical protein HY983_00445 [Candidatus Magasanikbacteria bacterium]|nr:hypothetical protein [Candidatus Magasanikbacteria bacterium]